VDNYRILLNYIYIPAVMNDTEIKGFCAIIDEQNIDRQGKYTHVHVHGEKSQRVADVLAHYGFNSVTGGKIILKSIVDTLVKEFDKSVFLRNLIILSKQTLPEDVKQKIEELFPSVKIYAVKLSQDKELSREVVLEEPKLREQKSDHYAIQTSTVNSRKLGNNGGVSDSKEPTIDPLNQNGSETINSLLSGSGGARNSVNILPLNILSIKPSLDIKPQERHLMSDLLDLKQFTQLKSINSNIGEYLEVYYGLKELRHATPGMKEIFTNSKSLPHDIPLHHLDNNLSVDNMVIPAAVSLEVQDILKAYAQRGHILVDYSSLLKMVTETRNCSETEGRNILLRMADLNIIVINCRQVTQSHSLNLVSLKLEILSLEDLYWVVKSLTLDKVTPLDDIVLSRIKEAFGLKIKRKQWSTILEKFMEVLEKKKYPVKAKPTSNSGDQSSGTNPASTPLPDFFDLSITKKEKLPNVQNSPDVYGFEIAKLQLQPEDVEDIPDDSPDWLFFKRYISEEFERDLLFYNNISSNVEPKKKSHLDKRIYGAQEGGSSMYNNSSGYLDSSSKVNPNSSVTEKTENSQIPAPSFKAISGGRYGMALFLKNFGPPELNKSSIGKLNRLVQKAIDQNHLKYYNTFLVKNSDTTDSILKHEIPEKSEKVEVSEKSQQTINIIKEKLYECLLESKNYLPLAQLVDKLSKKLGFNFDHREFGFVKLVQFIEKFFGSEVKIDKFGSNHTFLTLKEEIYDSLVKNRPTAVRTPSQESFLPILRDLSKDSSNLNARSLEHLQRLQSELINNQLNKEIFKGGNNHSWNCFHHSTSWARGEVNQGNLSTMGELKHLGGIIDQITRKHPEGIDIINFHKSLSNAIGEEFNHKKYGSDSLLHFLWTHFNRIIDIRKEKHGPTGMISVFIFPKNARSLFFAGGQGQKADDSSRFRGRALRLNSKPYGNNSVHESVDSNRLSPSPIHFQLGTPKEGFHHDRKLTLLSLDPGSSRTNSKPPMIFRSDLVESFTKEASLKKNSQFPNRQDMFNISYLDELPSYISPTNQNSMTNADRAPPGLGLNLSSDAEIALPRMSNRTHYQEENMHNTLYSVDLRDVLETLGNHFNDDMMSWRTFDGNYPEGEGSIGSLPLELSGLSALMWSQTNGLKPVHEAPHEKDKSDVEKSDEEKLDRNNESSSNGSPEIKPPTLHVSHSQPIPVKLRMASLDVQPSGKKTQEYPIEDYKDDVEQSISRDINKLLDDD